MPNRRTSDEKFLRLSRILKTMSAGNRALLLSSNEDELFQTMCDVIVEFSGYMMAWIGLCDHDEDKTIRPVAHAGHEEGYLRLIKVSWADNPYGRGPCGMAIRTRAPHFNNDINVNPSMKPWKELALARGYNSSISLPLIEKGDAFGTLTIYADEAHAFSPDEVNLLVDLADNVAFGIASLRTRRKHDEMEKVFRQIQKMDAIGQLTGGIAHDFNNLLQVILSNLDLSLHRLESDSIAYGYVKNAVAGAEYGAKLTDQLLSFSRRQPLRPEPLRVDRLVKDMISILGRTLGGNIDIQMETPGRLWTALVDSVQLQNAVLNMALNARDSMPEGGKLIIKTSNVLQHMFPHGNAQSSDYVMLEVRDTGIGMSHDVLEHVFEPFFTTKPEGSGTGLGLSMVYGFVQQSGGHIDIESELGHGTTIKLYLPRTKQRVPRRTVTDSPMPYGKGEYILIVEDNDSVRAAAVAQLSELRYRPIYAANAEEALNLITKQERIDLLLTDVVMSGALNGQQLADRVKKSAPNLPVIFASGYSEESIINQGQLKENTAILSKPYRLPELANALHSALKLSRTAEKTSSKPQNRAIQIVQDSYKESSRDFAAVRAHVLLVEDDDTIRDLTAELLEKEGYAVAKSASPSEADRKFDSDPRLNILITDFALPEQNGIELARSLLIRRPWLSVILTTGLNIDARTLKSNSIMVLRKPFHLQELLSAMEKVLTCGSVPLRRAVI